MAFPDAFSLLLVMAIAPARGWVTTSQSVYGAQIDQIQEQMRGVPTSRFVQAQLGGLWTMPLDPLSTVGLGGGITWAWDPALCDAIMPTFSEDVIFAEFITCDDAKAAVARAFAKWCVSPARTAPFDNRCRCMGWCTLATAA